MRLMAGRPTVQTPEMLAQAAGLRDEGYTLPQIADRLRISRSSVARALRQVHDVEEPVAQAAAMPGERWWENPNVEAAMVSAITRAGVRGDLACAWLLERIAPER
jgi:hypothetical protein